MLGSPQMARLSRVGPVFLGWLDAGLLPLKLLRGRRGAELFKCLYMKLSFKFELNL